MTKSFKKVIACLLAVLMVAFSAPISALAAFDPDVVSSYHPDAQIQFSTFVNVANQSFATEDMTNDADATWDYSGPYAPPIDATFTKDTTAGSIKVTKLTRAAAKTHGFIDNYNDVMEITGTEDAWEYPAADYDLTTGDYFVATVRLDNVTDISFASLAISYSDNITPAGPFQYKPKTKLLYGVGTAAELEEVDTKGNGAWASGFDPSAQIPAWSSDGLYTCDLVHEGTTTMSDNGQRRMNIQILPDSGQNETPGDLSSPDSDFPFPSPVDGSLGYTYEDTIILASFIFKITGDFDASNPIEFGVYDPDNTNSEFTGAYEGASYTCVDAKPKNYATYAENTASPASEQFTFFGMNINSGEGTQGGGETTTWTVTYLAEDGTTTISTETVDDGDAPANVPALPANTAHDTYSWSGDTTAAITADTTFTVVKTTSAHDYVGVPTAPTCTEAGYTTYTCSICGDSYTEAGAPATGHTPAAAVRENEVAATCTAAGSYDSVVYCSVCNAEISRTTETIAALGHDFGEWYEVTPATEEAAGLKRRDCSRCDAFEEEEIPKLDHTHVPGEPAQENVVAATCTEPGSYDLVTRCTACNEIISSEHFTTEALGHDYQDYEAAVAATCTEPGKEATQKCSRCGDVIGGAVIPATGHTPAAAVTENEVAATCTEAGSYDSVVYCSVCNAEISRTTETIAALGHDWSEWTVVTPATKTKKGEEKRTCSRCDAVETQEIASLPIAVTVQGDATMGAVDGIAINTTSEYSFGTAFTLTAQPADGYAFICWKINGKVVSENAIYSSKAYADVTIEPVFAKAEAESFDVVFLDLYKNVVKTQTVTSGAEIVAPTDAEMVRNGYIFKGWNIDDFTTITAPCEIKGQYDYDEEATGYTVTVLGTDSATIDGENATEKTGVKFDTKVTVSAEGAIGWKIGETVVATGDTYTFYVGSDVTVTAVFDGEVAKENKIVILDNYGLIPGSDYRYQFVATRTLASGAKAEKVGFVYGKNLADDELVIDKAGQNGAAADAGQIKVGYNNFTDGVLETVLQYGIKAKAGTIKARAFMIVNGEVIYSDIVTVSY